MQALISFVAKSLVDQPDEIEIVESANNNDELFFDVICAEGDAGKVIGRHGVTVKALRVLVNSLLAREGKSAFIEVRSMGE